MHLHAGEVERGAQHVYAQTTNGLLSQWIYTSGIGNSITLHSAGNLAGPPSTYITPGQQHRFARGANGHLHHWYWTSPPA